jgi:dolichol kinase
MVLAVGDPLGALIGRRFGKTVIRAGRTVEGSLAFVVAGALAVAATLLICYPALRTPLVAVVALLAAFGGAVAEVNTRRLDDNLMIPLGAALGAAVGLGLTGL